MIAYLLIAYIVSLIISIILIVTGIGLLNLRRWARLWACGYAWFAIIWGIIGVVVNIVSITSDLHGVSHENMPAVIGGAVGGMCGGIVGLVYPILLLIFMTRPNVIEACQK